MLWNLRAPEKVKGFLDIGEELLVVPRVIGKDAFPVKPPADLPVGKVIGAHGALPPLVPPAFSLALFRIENRGGGGEEFARFLFEDAHDKAVAPGSVVPPEAGTVIRLLDEGVMHGGLVRPAPHAEKDLVPLFPAVEVNLYLYCHTTFIYRGDLVPT